MSIPPKLGVEGTFIFYKNAKVPHEWEIMAQKSKAIDVLIKLFKIKLSDSGRNNRIYLLEGRTASGKSTYMISSLFNSIIKGTKTQILCSQPRVVLTESNANDVLSYFPAWRMGKEMGVMSSALKIRPQAESMMYCTTQILSDKLLDILSTKDKSNAERLMRKTKIIVVDEVHTLDLPMMSTLKVILDVLNKYGDNPYCPLFVFSSATIDIPALSKYYNVDLTDYTMCGVVRGAGNFPVTEIFMDRETIKRYNDLENEVKSRTLSFELLAKYVYREWYPKLWESKSYYEKNNNKVHCRDVLIFVPLKDGIDVICMTLEYLISGKSHQSKQMSDGDKDYHPQFQPLPVFAAISGCRFSEIVEWRNKHRNEKRVLLVGYARDYSNAGDEILSLPADPDEEALKNETKIFVSTGVMETGKTISTLQLVIDMGLNTTTISIPLSHTINSSIMTYARQLPANKNQTIQRMGRVGRQAPGTYVHFYTKEVYNMMRKGDIPQTIDCYCLSAMLLQTISIYPMYTRLDLMNQNFFLFPTSTDILLRSTQDLIRSGFLTTDGITSKFLHQSVTIGIDAIYAKYMYETKNASLSDAMAYGRVHKKDLPSYFSPDNFLASLSLPDDAALYRNDNPSIVDIDNVRRIRNKIVSVQYDRTDTLFGYFKEKLFVK